MREINIKSYSRKSKTGKTVQVRGYTRRVGRKGVKSPPRNSKANPGEELEKKLEEVIKKDPELAAEELERRRKWDEDFAEVEAERKRKGMSPTEHSMYLLRKTRERTNVNRERNEAISERKSKKEKKREDFFEELEDKIAKFVEKYSGKKYKR